MNDQTDDTLDQTDEDILSYTVSDEALEAAAGTGGVAVTVVASLPCGSVVSGCC
jgi:hypothetical protein